MRMRQDDPKERGIVLLKPLDSRQYSHFRIRAVQRLADVEDQALSLRLDFDTRAAYFMGTPMNADPHNDTFLDCVTRY